MSIITLLNVSARLGHYRGDSPIFLLLGAELPLMVESFGLLNDIFPFPSILDAGYPVFNLHLARIPLYSLSSASIKPSGSIPSLRVFSFQLCYMEG